MADHLRTLVCAAVAAALIGGCGYGVLEQPHPLLPVEELGPEDREGEPAFFPSATLPEKVDHSPGLAAPRDQGAEGSCMAFASTAGVEAFYRLGRHLSVEQMIKHLKAPNSMFLAQRLRGARLAEEAYWPYGGTARPDAASQARWGVDQARSTGVKPTTLMSYLAQGPGQNIILGYCHDNAYEVEWTALVNPRLSDSKAFWRRVTCNPKGMLDGTSGGHAVLLVGYEKRPDSDGRERVFFKFKNSWSTDWGEGGYGFMSSEYLRQLGISSVLITAGPKIE